MTSQPLPLALTMGEPAGVGAEVTLKAWLRAGDLGIPSFFLIDDRERVAKLAAMLNIATPVEAISDPLQAPHVFTRALPVLDHPLPAPVIPGELNPDNGQAVITAIEQAVKMTLAGRAGAVVTNPIHKHALHQVGFQFPGHTEFLAHLANTDNRPVMMLACSELRVVPVTIHVSLADATQDLSTEAIIETATTTHQALRRNFGIEAPRLAVAGLNPHAGEDGSMGHEDAAIIGPAVAALRAAGIDARGPLSADTLFHARARATYDAAICMYHDQALIPIKTIDFDGGVNVTLGLPFVRTSPDHGTALDLAGTGQAHETSLLAALHMAGVMAEHRRSA
ncbi:4-hydroxythreonine-4-phosphate dehydrogenase PdxA [Magnetospira sp. QH-2]|uniref:4-hydroxythreonine-4-phosphate dehydrogenase PdxA n=1 Tax=Magnetospira sp. (strain QH-2) TaxID=1288970 RepID=UPI0003E81099|nr:4-hydroxythreonine-4-phosphate dehydrogenase PdxA [Magnetospira sp. QH-2]CCQ74414.1 4-hydroxythreonine-4-phosphate dehydrogenase (4-(phosphohydroxy)-L-threonine dehydrogenase) [Magnetospira sp. QH-2]